MISFFKPTLKRKDMDSVLQTMVDEQIGPGEKGREFAGAFCEFTACKFGVPYRVYPDAIEAALKLLTPESTEENKKVIVQISPLAPLIYKKVIAKMGYKMVLSDVNPETGLLDPESVQKIQPDILVLYENSGTLPVFINQENIVEKYEFGNVRILEDVSQSIGSVCGEYKAGSWGNMVICSCEDNDLVSCAGGAILAANEGFSQLLRTHRPSVYKRMTDLNSALGYMQLMNLNENIERRREIYKLYQSGLLRTDNKHFGVNFTDFLNCAGDYPVLIKSRVEDVVKFANRKDIPVKETFASSICSEYEGRIIDELPYSAEFYYNCLSFPLYPFLRRDDIDLISKVVAHLP